MKIIREKNVVNTYNVIYFNCNLKIYKNNLLPIQNLGEAFASCLTAGYGSAKSKVYLEALKQGKSFMYEHAANSTEGSYLASRTCCVDRFSVETNTNATDFKFMKL